MAESRLRAARLYDATAPTHLYVDINVLSNAFSRNLDYRKLLYDAMSAERNYATTWSAGATGTHGGDAGFILQGLSEDLDRFILEYLRVNEAACD